VVLLDADASFCFEDRSLRTATPSEQTCATTHHLRRNGANEVGGGSEGPEADDASRDVANSRYRHRCLRIAIIGRSGHYFRLQISAAAGAYRFLRHAIPMLHQPSRQQRRGSLLEPDIQQFDDFLPDVRSIGQSGQLKALKRNARRREQKLPRRFIFHSSIHETRPVITTVYYQYNNNGKGH
jgi:hypothetical protein